MVGLRKATQGKEEGDVSWFGYGLNSPAPIGEPQKEVTVATTIVDSVDDQVITDLAREQVARIAPEELPLFQVTSEAFRKNPEKALKGQASRDEELGFGVEAGVVFLTPVALAVTTEVVRFVAGEVRKSVEAESAGLIREFVKRLFDRFRPARQEEEQKKTLPSLTPEQATQVRHLAFEKARQLDLPEAQAGLLADSLIGSLIMTTSQPEAP